MTENLDDYYRRQAREAKHQADRAVLPRDQAAWLRIAQSWLSLIRRKPATNAAEAFEDAVDERRTGQIGSDRVQ